MSHQLGQTRSQRRADHLLQTPETFVRAPLPGMQKATAIVHASPAGGAKFMQYTAELEPGGQLGPAAGQRFVYVLDGTADGGERSARAWRFRVPPGRPRRCRRPANGAARAAVIEKPYQPLDGVSRRLPLASAPRPPSRRRCSATIPGSRCVALIPDDPAFDFRVNTMTYQPGRVAGGGRDPRDGARPADARRRRHLPARTPTGIRSQAGDFIWMGPYCPQWFGAIGKTPAKYLIYKDWDRNPLNCNANADC